MAASVKTTQVSSSMKEAAMRKQLAEFREARKRRMMMRLSRNNPSSLHVSSLEAIAGIQPIRELSEDLSGTEVPFPKVTAPINKIPKEQMRKTLVFRHTTTSLKRATINNGVFRAHDQVKALSKPKPLPAPVKILKSNPKLTVPQSPTFSHRPARPLLSGKLVAETKESKPEMEAKSQKPSSWKSSVASKSESKAEVAQPTAMVDPKSCSSSNWMMPLTPDKGTSTVDGSTPKGTPKVKPFARKSFSETKLPRKSVQPPLNRSVHFLAVKSDVNSRRSTAAPASRPSLKSASRSSWMIQKEPSDTEKIQTWLEKRGRSVASCRHLGCLGHKIEDFAVPERNSNTRKSIKIVRAAVEEALSMASPQLKRQSSVLNTTFEKEDGEEAEEEPSGLQPSVAKVNATKTEETTELNTTFEKEKEEEVGVETEATTPLNTTFEKENEEEVGEELNEKVSSTAAVDLAEEKSMVSAGVSTEVTKDCHTPVEEATKGAPESTSLSAAEDNIEKLLEVIHGLLYQPIYPEAKIEAWLQKAESSFPIVQSHALYWEVRARLAEGRGETDAALDIYNQAVENDAQPMDLVAQHFDSFLRRIGSRLPAGQRTPFVDSLGLRSPRLEQLARKSKALSHTPRKPQLDSSQIFPSSVVKYELKLKRIFRTMEKDLKENGGSSTPVRASRFANEVIKTPLKTEASSNCISVLPESASSEFKLVATPVRRSNRPKSMHLPARAQHHHVLYVDDLSQLSPKTQANLELRTNKALLPSNN